jgi:hypothetical protein
MFMETLHKMEFDFNKMTACDEPFYGVGPRKAAYPRDRVCLLVTFGTKENFRMDVYRLHRPQQALPKGSLPSALHQPGRRLHTW